MAKKPKPELRDLISAVERMRVSMSPEISPEFIQAVIEIEAKYADDEERARAKLIELVDKTVASQVNG